MRMRHAAIALASATTMTVASMWAPATSSASVLANVELHAFLHPGTAFPRAHGHSEYDQEGAKRELDVTVRVPRLAGRSVSVRVHGTLVGRVPVSAGGVAHREWETEHGDGVPTVSAGDVMRVTAPSGRLVVSGRYQHGD